MDRHAKSRLLEDKQALQHELENGRGGFWMELNEEHYPDPAQA
jgi:hypothetical protein